MKPFSWMLSQRPWTWFPISPATTFGMRSLSGCMVMSASRTMPSVRRSDPSTRFAPSLYDAVNVAAPGVFVGTIRDRRRDRAADGGIVDDRPQPRERVERQARDRIGTARRPCAASRSPASIRTWSAYALVGVTLRGVPVRRELRLDVADVRERPVACAVGHCEAGEPREHERFGGLDADVRLRDRRRGSTC